MKKKSVSRPFPNCLVRCFRCDKWKQDTDISRDGYFIHHQGYSLASVIVSWKPICKPCSTRWGRFCSVLVRLFGKAFHGYLHFKVKRQRRRDGYGM